MISIVEKWGAMYLCFDQKIKIYPDELITTNLIRISPGDKIVRFGTQKRTSFILNDGVFMIYEGIYKEGKIKYAVFNCPAHEQVPNVQLDLFSKPKNHNIQYRYVFSCVFLKSRLNKLLIHKNNSCSDVDVSSITFLYDTNEKD